MTMRDRAELGEVIILVSHNYSQSLASHVLPSADPWRADLSRTPDFMVSGERIELPTNGLQTGGRFVGK